MQKVAANSPAEKAGLRPSRVPATVAGVSLLIGGDVILSLAGVDITDNLMGDMEEMGDEMPTIGGARLRVFRAGEIIELDIPVSATPFRDAKGKRKRKR